ncbi:MAG TPA: response regulator [Candidatus Polarisedimenticolaceae bacterium]
MNLRCVLVDDESPARDRLRRMLAEHADVEIVGEAGDVETAVALVDGERPDLLFLDVQMPGGDGFEVLRRLEHLPRVVFTTAFDQYAVRAFEVNSVDYLLKPFAKPRLAAALDRVRAAVAAKEDASAPVARVLEAMKPPGQPLPFRIPAKRGAKIVLLDPSEIAWFEADDTLVHARVGETRYLVEKSLAELEVSLEGSFFRTHRAYLVNLAKIGEIVPGDAGTYRLVIRDEAKTQLPLSRRQAQKLRERIPW